MLLPGGARASTIVSISGPANSAYTIGTSLHQQILETSWTAATGYSNVAISAELSREILSNMTVVTAFLTAAIGAGETASNQIAATTITPSRPFPAFATETLFSGLTLPAGTYYLVLGGAVALEGEWWGTASSPPTIETAPGVSYGGDGSTSINPPLYFGFPDENNPPDSTFVPATATNPINLIFSVTGTPTAAIPEPATHLLVAAPLLSLVLLRKYRKLE
ncbi:MAG: hypothetical protein JO091_11875 [Acidobacteriaceae bacterium]|nr:hypothetical protein [Acidobacteriaceae bacterium]